MHVTRATFMRFMSENYKGKNFLVKKTEIDYQFIHNLLLFDPFSYQLPYINSLFNNSPLGGIFKERLMWALNREGERLVKN